MNSAGDKLMRDKLSVILHALFESVKYSVEAFSLPTGKHLIPSIIFGAIILAVSVISELFHLFTFISWQGALIGELFLITILIIERSERHEVSAFYSTAKNSVEAVVRRAKNLTNARTSQVSEPDSGSSNQGSDVESEPDGSVTDSDLD